MRQESQGSSRRNFIGEFDTPEAPISIKASLMIILLKKLRIFIEKHFGTLRDLIDCIEN